MPLEFWFPSVPVPENAVFQFEKIIGHQLPHEYRHFLMVFNGGSKPIKENFVVSETQERTMLSDFYSLDHAGRGELHAEYIAMREELPSSCLSIGQDIGGNKLCLVVEGVELGKVLFLDHERRSFVKKISRDDLAVCADSFGRLLTFFE
jgi:SMI1-KNR4 cell-wall